MFKFCSLNVNNRLVIIGCENLSGFEVVEKGEALNIEIIDKQLIDYGILNNSVIHLFI